MLLVLGLLLDLFMPKISRLVFSRSLACEIWRVECSANAPKFPVKRRLRDYKEDITLSFVQTRNWSATVQLDQGTTK